MRMKKHNHGVTIVEILLSIMIIGMVVIILFNMLVNVRNEDRNNQIQSRYVLNQAQFTERIQEDLIDYGISQISACDIYQVDVESYNLNDMYRSDFKCLRFDFADEGLIDNIGFLMIYNYNQKYDVNKKENSITGRDNSWMIRYIRGHYDYSGDSPTWITLNSLMNEIPDEVQLGKISVQYTVNFYPSAEERHVNSIDNPSHLVANFNINSDNVVDDIIVPLELPANTENIPNYKETVGVSPKSNLIPNIARINVPIISESGEHYDIDLSYSSVGHGGVFMRCISGDNTGAAYASIKCDCIGDDYACQQSKIPNV